MKLEACKICGTKKNKIIWNDKIRAGKKLSKKKIKIFQCLRCKVRYKEKFDITLNDNKVFRKLYDGASSIERYESFNKPRELKKIKFIEQFIDIKKKSILETNCGAASILDYLKKKKCTTYGQDHKIYRNFVEKKHTFFDNLQNIKRKFDIILSLAELEHKPDVLLFLKNLKNLLNKNGKLILRIPNYKNIYYYFIGYNFQQFDFRSSHNFYFCEDSLDYLFKKLNFKIELKQGYNEYDINHFLHYMKTQKRVNKYKNFINEKLNNKIIDNINKNYLSTSFIYIISKN
jgi:SAM-dependent methyltransferase|tara:strand:+ start:3186 stop:4049 length:864 start_codon:yes stop_codon:yes gene_type:complete